MNAVALLLADGRWPGGGSSHSGGLEAAVAAGAVQGPRALEAFVAGRLTTVGLGEAWAAAAACAAADHPAADLRALARELDARTPSPAQRAAGRSLGRGLRRVAAQCWPQVATCPVEQYALVLGVVAAAAGLAPAEAARLAVHHALFGPLNAAPKLFAIDMADVCAVAVRLAPLADAVVAEALDALERDDPPAWSAPVLEERAEAHARWEVRLFAS